MKKHILLSLAAALLFAGHAIAADNYTEFYLEDDLTVKGTGGTQQDPDLEVKGFTVFGSTAPAPVFVPVAPGNVFVNGYLQISSGLYVAAGSTFTGRMDIFNPDIANSSYTLRVSTDGSVYHLVVTTQGWVGLNQPQPHARLHLSGTGDDSGIIVEHQGEPGTDLWDGPWLANVRSRGNPGAQSPVGIDDGLGSLMFLGNDGLEGSDGPYRNSSAIHAAVDGPVSNNNVPGRLVFYTSPGTNQLLPRLVIKADGRVGISTMMPQAALDIVSTGTYAQIWRSATGLAVATMSAEGVLSASLNVSSVSARFLQISTAPGTNMMQVSTSGVALGQLDHSTGSFLSVAAIAPNPSSGPEEHSLAISGFLMGRNLDSNDIIAGGNFESELDGGSAALVGGLRAAAQVRSGNAKKLMGILVDEFEMESGTADEAYGIYIATLTGKAGKLYSVYSQDPRATAFSAGPVGIGTDNIKGSFVVFSTVTTDNDSIVAIQQIGGDRPAGILAIKAGGTPEALQPLTEGATVFALVTAGRAASDYAMGASMDVIVDGTPGTYLPTGILFKTSDGASADPKSRLVIRADGRVGISTDTPQAALDVRSLQSGATAQVQAWRDSSGVVTSSLSAGGIFYSSAIVLSNSQSGVRIDTMAVANISALANTFHAPGDNGRVGLNVFAATDLQGGNSGDFLVGQNIETAVIGSDDLDTLMALRLDLRKEGDTAASIVDKAYGLMIDRIYVDGPAGGGTFNNTYGIYIGKQSDSYLTQTNLPYAVYSEDPVARSYFSGNVTVGVSSATPYTLRLSTSVASSSVILAVSTGTGAALADVFWVDAMGEVHARKFHGDAAGLTGVNGDSLGNHIATTTLQMGNYWVNSSSAVSAAYYQISGSTVISLTGTSGVGIGVGAGVRNTGSNSTFVGSLAGNMNTSGNFNTFVGAAAGSANTVGSGNSFLGKWAGHQNSSGQNNTLVGESAAYYNDTGSANVLVGRGAGFGPGLGNSFSSSTAVGFEAGYNLGTGSGSNLLVGYRAGYNINSGTGNIVIGYGQDVLGADHSNRLNIGGLLFGRLDGGAIGISTRSPAAALDIVSTGAAADVYAQIWRDNGGAILSSMSSTGVMRANFFEGNGSRLTGVGDNLGNHNASNDLQMNWRHILTLSNLESTGTVNAARYQVNGNDILTLSGTNSISMGYQAGRVNTNSNNLFIGEGSGYFNASGSNNIYMGYSAGSYGTSSENIAIGAQSLAFNSTGGQNTVLGVKAGYGQNGYSFSNATLIGYQAGYSLQSANADTAVGYQAGYNLTTGHSNTLLGYQAGYTISSGTGNIIIGYAQGASGNTASNELNIGGLIIGRMDTSSVTVRGTMGANDYRIGVSTVLAIGVDHTTVKLGALSGGQTTAAYSNFIGYASGRVNSTGNQNNFMGYQAGYANTTGGNNTFVGSSAGMANTSGKENSFYGDNAGYTNNTGSMNTALGASAGNGAGSYSATTLVGARAGDSLSGGEHNLLLGFNAGSNIAAGSRNIVLGSSQTTSAPGVNDELNIGGVLFGRLEARVIGISTRNPQAALDIVSTGTAADVYAQLWRNSGGAAVATMTSYGQLQAGSLIVSSFSTPGLYISSSGSVYTIGAGEGGVSPASRSAVGAVDLQITRTNAANIASGLYSTLTGGYDNKASGGYSVVGGGNNNTASNGWTYVGGGISNQATQNSAVVAGGENNVASGARAAILGGYANTAAGQHSVVPGGSDNSAAGNYSFSAGYKSYSPAAGAFTWSDSAGVQLDNAVADRAVFKSRGGFLVTGSTNTVLKGAVDRGVMITGQGTVGISTGLPQAALDVVSTFTAANTYAQIWRDAQGVIVASVSATGVVSAGNFFNAPNYKIGSNTVLAVLSNDSLGVGVGAGKYHAGSRDTYLGYNTGFTSGNDNTFLGYTAGGTTTGNQNTFVGSYAGQASSAGSDNTFVGARAGFTNTSGIRSTFVGTEAGQQNTSGSENSMLGYMAGYENTTGTNNSLLGAYAGYYNQTGSGNTIVGYKAGSWGGGASSFSSSTIMGYQAGYNLNTGVNNIFLGWQAGYSVSSGSGNIIIGYNQDASGGSANNELNLGGTLYGNLVTGVVSMPKQSSVVASATVGSLGTIGSWSIINSFTDSYDTQYEMGSSSFTAKSAGRYLVTINSTFSAVPASQFASVGVAVNGAASPAFYTSLTTILTSANQGMSFSHVFNLAANDYLKFYYYASAAGFTTMNSALSVVKLN